MLERQEPALEGPGPAYFERRKRPSFVPRRRVLAIRLRRVL